MFGCGRKKRVVADEASIYNCFRNKIISEDTLINYRMSWMLWSEAILFAIWGALIKEGKELTFVVSVAMSIVSVVGLWVAIGSRASINAARGEIEEIKKEYKIMHPALYGSERITPRLHAAKHNHILGALLAKTMPVIFAVMQLAILAYTWVLFYFSRAN